MFGVDLKFCFCCRKLTVLEQYLIVLLKIQFLVSENFLVQNIFLTSIIHIFLFRLLDESKVRWFNAL